MKEKKVKRYNFARKPRRASRLWMWLANIVAVRPELKGFTYKIEKKGMEGLKPPYLLLATHASTMDFAIMYRAIRPYKLANNVVAIDGFHDYGRYLMSRLGCICKRKFIKDLNLIRNLRYCANTYGDVVCMYPEARYSLDGCESYIPPSVGKLCKLLGIPVVVLRMYGNFIIGPQWNLARQRLPLEAVIEQIVTKEETQTLPVDEINARIRASFQRDDFRYQLERGIKNTYENRADGLHHILYRCPHCNTEFKMYSSGTRLWCDECKKSWQMTELGQLQAEEGETEFAHIPDWFKWERKLVREEVRSGSYRFEDEVEVYTLPDYKRFLPQGKGKIVQTEEGIVLECTAYGKPTVVEWKAIELESVHIQYDYTLPKRRYKNNFMGDSLDLSTADESYWVHPVNRRDNLTKISFATEEIFELAHERMKEGK